MKTTAKPIQNTIIWGGICGISFIPLCWGLSHFILWPKAVNLSLGAFLTVYGFLLTRWSNKAPVSIFFPLVLLLLAAFLINSTLAFLLMALMILSWIRSGICFEESLVKIVGPEIALSFGGGVLLSSLVPTAAVTWSLGIWMFFLFQALYFVVFERCESARDSIEVDLFEKAKMGAEKILSPEI
jgi:hypothetical protein